MFRRDPQAIKAYNENKPAVCAAMQTKILTNAAKMLKPGGSIVYSTCTFNRIENEDVISAFIEKNPDIRMESAHRIMPHTSIGEGHFAALLVKMQSSGSMSKPALAAVNIQQHNEYIQFCELSLTSAPGKFFIRHGKSLYITPVPLDLQGLRVVRSGWHIGDISKGRFTPSQAFAMGLTKKDVVHSISLSEENAKRFLKGGSLESEVEAEGKPWVMICYEGYPLGWARLVGGRLKNQLPPGWVIKSGL